MAAHDYRKMELMKTIGQIPLRYVHTGSVNFTLPVHQKPLAATLLPFSLKKATGKIRRVELELPPSR
jgi:hypothetical protein